MPPANRIPSGRRSTARRRSHSTLFFLPFTPLHNKSRLMILSPLLVSATAGNAVLKQVPGRFCFLSGADAIFPSTARLLTNATCVRIAYGVRLRSYKCRTIGDLAQLIERHVVCIVSERWCAELKRTSAENE
jgi:hypothetical protein